MITQALIEKLNTNMESLQKEVQEIKRTLFILASTNDPEGEYKATFVQKMLKRAGSQHTHAFTTGEAFLKRVRTQ